MKVFTKVLGLAVTAVFAGQAMALDALGAAKASLGNDNVSVGLEYSVSDMSMERKSGFTTPNNIEHDMTQEKTGLRIGFGLNDSTDLTFRVGTSNTDETRRTGGGGGFPSNTAMWDFDGDNDPYWGVGLTTDVTEVAGVPVGLSISYTENENTTNTTVNRSGGGPANNDTSWSELQVAIGASGSVADMVSLYGGVFLYRLDGDTLTVNGGNVQKGVLEQSNDYGAYLGATISATEALSVNVELQSTEEASLASVGVAMAF